MPLTLESVRNPQYADAQNQRINCELKWEEMDEWLPFTADPNDGEEHGRQIHALILEGTFGAIAAYVPPPLPTQAELDEIARKQALKDEAAVDAFIEKLRSATPTQIKDWVQANVTDLASAKTTLGKLAVAVAFLLSGQK